MPKKHIANDGSEDGGRFSGRIDRGHPDKVVLYPVVDDGKGESSAPIDHVHGKRGVQLREHVSKSVRVKEGRFQTSSCGVSLAISDRTVPNSMVTIATRPALRTTTIQYRTL